MGMGRLNAVLLLFLFDLLKDPRQLFVLDLIAGDLVLDLLQLVDFLQVLKFDISLLRLTDLPLLVLIQLLGQELIDPGLILLPLRDELLELFLLNDLYLNQF